MSNLLGKLLGKLRFLSFQAQLDRSQRKLVLAIFAVNLAVAVFATQIFSADYPLGIDSFSHLPKILYLSKHGISSWNFDWYGGYPFFISYSPLAYFIAYMPTIFGLDATLSYKLVEIVFLVLTPYVFFGFCRKLNMEKTRSLYAALLFSIIPFTVQNSIFFGRFPNIVGYPFFLATLIYVSDILRSHSKRSILYASIFFSLTLLTHHLSAYILAIVIAIFGIGLVFENSDVRHRLSKLFSLGGSLSIGCVISSFWLVPFFIYLKYWSPAGTDSLRLTLLPFSAIIFILVVAALYWTLRRVFPSRDFNSGVILTWVACFFLLGSSIPLDYILPFGGEIDPLRFQLYSSVAVAVLLATPRNYRLGGIFRVFHVRPKLHRTRVWVVVLAALNILIAAIFIQAAPTVVADEVYVEDLPQPIVEYLSSNEEYGRILAIDCPYWVYILPYYTDKSLIDGWYPQGSLLPAIKEATFSITPVAKTLNSVNNDTSLRYFIDRAEDYGVKWVLLGNHSRLYLFSNSTFHPVMEESRFILLENRVAVRYVETQPESRVDWYHDKDSVIILMETPGSTTTVIVKEAYFPGWYVFDNGLRVEVSQNEYGFIKFTVHGVGKHTVKMVFKTYEELLPEELSPLLELQQ